MPFLFYQSLHFPYYPTNNFWLIIPKNKNFKIWNFKNWAKHRSQLVLGHTKQNIQYSWVCNRLKTTNKTRKKTTNHHLDQRSMWDLMPSLYSCMWNSQKPNSRREVPVQPSASNWFNTIWKSPQITWKPLSDQALTLLSSPVLKTSYQKLFLGRGKENPQWRWPHEMQKLFKPKLHLHSGLTAWDWDLSATLWATSTNKRIWQRGLCMGMHLGYGWQFVFGINFNHRRRIIDAESESKCMHRTNKIEIRHWKQNMNLQRPSIGCKERKNRNIYQDFLENPQKNATRIHPSTNTFVNATPHPKIWKKSRQKNQVCFPSCSSWMIIPLTRDEDDVFWNTIEVASQFKLLLPTVGVLDLCLILGFKIDQHGLSSRFIHNKFAQERSCDIPCQSVMRWWVIFGHNSQGFVTPPLLPTTVICSECDLWQLLRLAPPENTSSSNRLVPTTRRYF